MLKVYKTKYYYKVDGGEWVKVGGTGEVIEDRTDMPEEDFIFRSWTWQQIIDFLKLQDMCGFELRRTLFRKRPYFSCCDLDYYCDPFQYFFEGDFKKFTYKRVYIENEDVSLQYIMNEFPAEKCIQYLKERGITSCPINNTK